MKDQLLLFFISFISLTSFAQTEFQKGYYIDNTNKRIECFIKNIEWLDNPVEFKYKLSESKEDYQTTNINFVKEFGVYSKSKYIRNKVEIDRSSNFVTSLSRMSTPNFNEEELFLKVLVEGKANLYQYTDGDITRFFYSFNNEKIKQLVYKKYITKAEFRIGDRKDVVAENNYYKQQLWNDLKCPNFSPNKLKNINYQKKDLVNFFIEYSQCNDNNIMSFKEEDDKRKFLNLTLRPRINNSSLTLNNDGSTPSPRSTDYGSKIGFGFGIEIEYIFPFNNGKWSFLIEPTFQNFKSEKTSRVNNPFDGDLKREINYRTIEIPLSVRHYFFLNKKSKLFIDASLVTNIDLNSSFKISINDIPTNPLKVTSGNNFAIGFGYKYNNRYNVETRFQTSRGILMDQRNWTSDFKTLSIILGYSLF